MVDNNGKQNGNNVNLNTSEATMNPCAYRHFLAKLQTSQVKNLETREKMQEEGASQEVLQKLDQVSESISQAILAIRDAIEAREGEMEAEKANKRALREAEKAARQAAKEAKASSPKPQPVASQEDGPQGPTALGRLAA